MCGKEIMIISTFHGNIHNKCSRFTNWVLRKEAGRVHTGKMFSREEILHPLCMLVRKNIFDIICDQPWLSCKQQLVKLKLRLCCRVRVAPTTNQSRLPLL